MSHSDFYYQLTTDPEEIHEFYQLIEKVYVVEHDYDIEVYDPYARDADHYIFKNNNEVIAGFRINRASRITDLPSGQCTPFNPPPYHCCGEITRWAILPAWRKKLSTVKTFRDFALYAQHHDVDFYIAKVMPAMVNFYSRFGLTQMSDAFYDSITFNKLKEPDDKNPNFLIMLLSKDVLYERYLTIDE